MKKSLSDFVWRVTVKIELVKFKNQGVKKMGDVAVYGSKDVSVLQNITGEINTLHKEIKEAMETAFQKSLKLGELLSCAKATLPHGEFGKWIEANCNFSYPTSNRYIKLYEGKQILLDNGIQSLSAAYKLIGLKKDKSITVRDLKNEDSSDNSDLDDEKIIDADFTFEEIDESKELSEAYKKIEQLKNDKEELEHDLDKYQYEALTAKKKLDEEETFYSDPNIRDAIKNMALMKSNLQAELPKVAELEIQFKNIEKFFQKNAFQLFGIEVEDVHKEIFRDRVIALVAVISDWSKAVSEKFGVENEVD
jgi:hypothetical protein